MNKITEAKIKQWKAKYGDVHKITVPLEDPVLDEDGEIVKECELFAVGYFRKPDLKTIAAAQSFAKKDEVKAGMILYENTVLEADEALKTNDAAKLSAIAQVSKLFRVRQATMVKL